MNEENRIIIAGYKGGGSSTHTPVEGPEGVITGTDTTRKLSKTQIETLDILSEGEIQGLVTGEYLYTGIIGQIGWSGVVFNTNNVAIGTQTRWLQSVFWNDTPVVDKTGQYNFQQINLNFAKGGPNGTNVSDSILDELTVTRIISERLYGGGENFSKIYRITDKDCIGSEVNIRINQLAEQNSQGDIYDSTVSYIIYYKPLFNNRTVNTYTIGKQETITGKVTNGYIRTSRIDFNTNYSNDDTFLGWEIKVVRSTSDSTTVLIRNQTFIDSLTEIYGSKFIYPNTAIVSSLFDAQYFSNIPARTYLSQGLKVKIPNNYNPIYKTYDESTGPWDGSFKEYLTGPDLGKIQKEWSDNPAWCYYDLLSNKRYGLGNYIDENFIDKFSLYEISKYCDTLVSDGYGGLEPRFTCNTYITSQEEAYKMINSMASIFRGITYYSAGQIYTVQDAEKPPIYQFTNANVLDGDFNYSSSAKKARHTIAVVRYNDKKNLYKPTLEYVEDIDAIRKYGLREVEVPAFGCSSRGQAIRLGRWALLTESLETESINFKAGLDVAGFLRPGDVFQIYDANRKTQRLGGRLYDIVVSPTSSNLTLDSEITGLNAQTSYRLSLLTPTFYYDPSQITSDEGLNSSGFASGFRRSNLQHLTFNTTNTSTISGRTNIIVNQTLDYINYDVSGNYVWMVEATGANIYGNIGNNEWDTYRVINIKENDSHIYEIDGLQYEVNKFLQVESGFSFNRFCLWASISFRFSEWFKFKRN
jgi:predicted phage tail protein